MSTSEAASPNVPARSVAKIPIPAVVKRNTALLSLCQAFVGWGNQMVPTVGPLIVQQLTASVALAGIGSSLITGSRFLISYPLGKVMDKYGRRAGLVLGMSLGAVGSVIVGMSPLLSSFALFIFGVLVFGMGAAAVQQLRVAAADMYPSSRRAEGLGYVLMGSLIGSLAAPLVVSLAEPLSRRSQIDVLAWPWFLVAVAMVPGILMVGSIRPDPKEIAANLAKYYPSCVSDQVAAENVIDAPRRVAANSRQIAYLVAATTHGVMLMIMTVSPIVMQHHHGLPAITLTVSIHVIGMYVFSLPIGRLADVIGRRVLLLSGLVIVAASTAVVPMSQQYWAITLSLFMVGVGWPCANVAATALIADATAPDRRGRAIGLCDTFNAGAGAVMAFAGGPIIEYLGMGAIGPVGVAVSIVPFLLALRLRETRSNLAAV